jgi:hypothetical protein
MTEDEFGPARSCLARSKIRLRRSALWCLMNERETAEGEIRRTMTLATLAMAAGVAVMLLAGNQIQTTGQHDNRDAGSASRVIAPR